MVVEDSEQQYATFTCSAEGQTGKDTLESVAVDWFHNGYPTDVDRYTVLNRTVLNVHKGYMMVNSSLAIHGLRQGNSGDVSCWISITLTTAQDKRQEVVRLSASTMLLIISE